MPDQQRVLEGMAREDLFTVVFDQVMTDTAVFADVILPATTFLEAYDFARGYGPLSLQLVRPVIDAVGESRSNPEVFGELARRLELLQGAEPDNELEMLLQIFKTLPGTVGAQMEEAGRATPPFGVRPIQFVDVHPRTFDQKVDLFPAALDAEAPLGLYTYQPDPATERFPLALISPSSDKTISSMLGELPRPAVALLMHPADAATRGLKDDDPIKVFNELGEVQCAVKIEATIREGTVSLPKGLWRKSTWNQMTSNALVPDALTDLGAGACFNDARVEVAKLETPVSIPVNLEQQRKQDIAAFRDAVTSGDVPLVRQLLTSAHVQKEINAPMFAFGQRAAHMAAKNVDMLEVLLAAGADVNLRSEWENGPYTVLDNANDDTAQFLLGRGATLTANVAARLGWFDELQRLITADRALVHARGGDGQQPLHEAKTVAIADFLLDHGADVDARCIDHKSTPAQYALVDRPDVCRRLLERGAMPDIYMAACLGDVALATRILDADPAAAAARVNQAGYAPVPPMHIYCWTLGFGMSPHDVALKFGHRDVRDLLEARSAAPVRFLNAVIAGDEPAARALLDADASLLSSLTREVHGHLAQAIFHCHDRAAELMLRLGFDETAPGVDGGTALHAACWVGNVGWSRFFSNAAA